jgi:hypothetical protein
MSWELILSVVVVLLIAVNLPESVLLILMLLVWTVGFTALFVGELF